MEKRIYDAMRSVEDAHWWFQGRNRTIMSILRSLLDGQKRLNILDIGCGTGGQMQHLQKYGNVVGVDISKDAVKYCKDRGLHARVGITSALPSADEEYEVVTAFDVLEHFDDTIAVQEIERVLKPGGWFIFTVPAYKFLWSRHDEIHHHMRRYTRTLIYALLNKTQLVPSRVSYYNIFLLPIVFALRKIPTLKSAVSPESLLRVPNRHLNHALLSILSSEKYLLQLFDLPAGVSLIGIAQKHLKS